MIYFAMLERTVIRGTLVNVFSLGVLIQGISGSGKSMAALSLMRHGHRFIADDLVLVTRQGPEGLMGQPVENKSRIEVRGLGIFDTCALFKDSVLKMGPVDMVVELTSFIDDRDTGRTEPLISKVTILGRELDKVLAPVPSGMDPGFLVELVVRAHSHRIVEKSWEDVK